jgi:hypothetical protein
MTEHDDHLTQEEQFFRAENIKYFKSFEDLPDGEWTCIDDRVSLEDFKQPGQEGTSTALDFYRTEFGEFFVVVPTNMPVNPEIKEPLYDVYIDERQLFPEVVDDDLNVVDIRMYADIVHNNKIMEGLHAIFDGVRNGMVVEDMFDVPGEWALRRQAINTSGALAEITMFIASDRQWRVAPLRERDSDKMVLDRVMLYVEPPKPTLDDEKTQDESTFIPHGRDFRLILGEGGGDIDKS